MKILFIHRDFPAQFKHLSQVLALNPNNLVLFITANDTVDAPQGINKLVYKIPEKNPSGGNPYLKDCDLAVAHGRAVAEIASAMKQQGIIPDIIIGHSWGSTMFMKDIFPDIPLLCYFEWFDNADGAAIGFDGKLPDLNYRETIRCNNAYKLIELYSCNGGISPTQWQKTQFPKEFHEKIKVIHDGVNTDICKPDASAKFKINEKLTLSPNDEVITYATRGMEPMRGFPQFIEAAEKILKKRPNAHIVIGGNDKVFYGEPLKKGSYKELMLKQHKLDLKRVHFVGGLDFDEYIKLLQVSSVHVYLTYPFILSWSFLEAMSVGCCMIASGTAPVIEVMKDNYNGLLVDFYNVDQLVEKIEYALDNKKGMEEIRQNARQTVLDNYDLKNMLQKQIEYMIKLMQK